MADADTIDAQTPDPDASRPTEITVDDIRAKLAAKEAEAAKHEREAARLAKVAQKYDERVKADEDAKRKRAEEEGRWKELHQTAETQAKEAEARIKALEEQLASRDETMSSQVKATLDAIEDAKTRKAIATAVDGLDPYKAHEIVGAMVATLGARPSAPTSPKGGTPGRPRGHKPTFADLAERSAKGSELRMQSTLAAVQAKLRKEG